MLRHLVSSMPEPVGSWERFFILPSFYDWCSLYSVSTGCCLTGSDLCSSSSQLSFSFPANVCWGPGGVIPLGPLRVLIRLLRLFCSFLSTFVYSSFLCLTFSCLRSRVFQWDLAFGLQYSHLHVCHVRGVFVCLILRYVFFSRCLSRFLVFLVLLRQHC